MNQSILDPFHFQDINDAFEGKLYAFIPVIKDGYGLGVAVANEYGYTPVAKFFYTAESMKQAQKDAMALNEAIGRSKESAFDIMFSSMARPS